MKCPLTFKTGYFLPGEWSVRGGNCIKEECVWWLKGAGYCTLPWVAEKLFHIEMLLAEIKDKMPHKGQFTR